MPRKQKPKSVRGTSVPAMTALATAEYHRLKGVEAKWNEMCVVLEVEPHLAVLEILKVLYADRHEYESVWSANWEALCGFLELDPLDSYTKNEGIVANMRVNASHFINLCETLQAAPESKTAGGVMNIIKHCERVAHSLGGAEIQERCTSELMGSRGEATRWHNLCNQHIADLRGALDSSDAWSGLIGSVNHLKANLRVDQHVARTEGNTAAIKEIVEKVSQILGEPVHTLTGVYAGIGMLRNNALKTVEARLVRADKWDVLCAHYAMSTDSALADAEKHIGNVEYKKYESRMHESAKWSSFCAVYGMQTTVNINEAKERITDVLTRTKVYERVFPTGDVRVKLAILLGVAEPERCHWNHVLAAAQGVSNQQTRAEKYEELCKRYGEESHCSVATLVTSIVLQVRHSGQSPAGAAKELKLFWSKLCAAVELTERELSSYNMDYVVTCVQRRVESHKKWVALTPLWDIQEPPTYQRLRVYTGPRD